MISKEGAIGSYIIFIYLSKQPLSETLKAVASNGKVQWSRLKGKAVLECVVEEPGKRERTLYLDPSQEWQPIRIATNTPIPRGMSTTNDEFERMTTDAKSFLRKDGVVLPSRVDIVWEKIDFQGQRKVVSERKYMIFSLEVSPNIADSVFVNLFPKGTRVADFIRDIGYVEGMPNSEHKLNRRGGIDLFQSSPGVAWIWWADTRIWLALSFTAIIAIGVNYWRQHRSQRI